MPRRDEPATASRAEAQPFRIGGHEVPPGGRLRFDQPLALLPTHTRIDLPLTVLHGARPGPRVWLSAAVHGDEINGVEIIRRTLEALGDGVRGGTLIAAPIVNVFGFLEQSRYLPDRRDLNRSFPGSERGSLAARIAHMFLRDVVDRCTHGIDLHTASTDRVNYPQVRADLDDPECLRMALAFDPPVLVHSAVRSGSLRAAATKRGIPAIVYEGGEPLRFNRRAIETGVRGVLGVLAEVGMIPRRRTRRRRQPLRVEDSRWVRARRGGLLRLETEVGQEVRARQVIGTISDPFGESSIALRAPVHGLVIGATRNPIVHAGDAVVHLGRLAER